MRVHLNQLLSMSSRLWIGGRWYSNATLRAYVEKDRLDDIEISDLGTLVKQTEINVSSGKMKCTRKQKENRKGLTRKAGSWSQIMNRDLNAKYQGT